MNFALIWKLLVPVVLIILGLSLIFKDSLSSIVRKEIKNIRKERVFDKEYSATFAGQNLKFVDEEFEDCEMSAVFGGIKCDIRQANIPDKCVIKCNAIFGGITIYVPDNVNIKISSVPIFGGISDARREKNSDAEKTIYIDATCMFGGVDIK